MVMLVDKDDHPIGQVSKTEAHEKGFLHRAFSVFILNTAGELLMQQRAMDKYHSAGLWANTCCSHPYPEENIGDAARRRLWEEMRMKTELKFLFKFQYYTAFDNGLFEHEIDSVFVGYTDDKPMINQKEVHTFKYMSIPGIEEDIQKNPQNYTVWFKIIFERFLKEFDFKELEITL